jgi:predicted phosphodiesterase
MTLNAVREVCVSRQAHCGCSQSRYNCCEFENKPVGSLVHLGSVFSNNELEETATAKDFSVVRGNC